MLTAGRVALLAYDPGGATQNIGAATGTITLTGIPGAISAAGAVSIGAATGTITVAGVAGAISSAGSLSIGAATGTITLTGVSGAISGSGAVSIGAATGTTTLTGIAGAITLVSVVIGTVQYRFGRARKSYEFGKITKEPT